MSTRDWGPSASAVVTVNGRPREVLADGARRLVTTLRNELGLTGTKVGCEVGVCGACTVLVDRRPTSSCLTLTAQVEGSEVTTIEGLSTDPRVRELRDAFITEGGFQCGFCTSGQIVTAAALILSGQLSEMSSDDVREVMLGNLCRCTGYYGILRAIESVRRSS